MNPAEEGPYTAGTVARRLGIADATLRSWHRRYGIGPEDHRSGTYRLYTEEDFARLSRMRQLISEGVPASQAARIVRSTSQPLAWSSSDPDMTAESLTAHARRLDAAQCISIVRASLVGLGVKPTWNQLCRPALAMINDSPHQSDLIDVTKMLAWVIVSCLHGSSLGPPGPRMRPRILLAAPDGEEHTLCLEILRTLLHRRGFGTVFLGPSVPDHALRQSHDRCAPDATVLFAIRPETARVGAFRQLDPATVVLAGPGWSGTTGPRQPVQADSLDAALNQVTRIAWRK